ncbi:MAG: fibrobacter succinogenes major paralogous domain-containing protein [Bacteroidetes bacterium]|nr:fibrobacter succinogenes major paralogous domain-containing protein [Bacteroidota bacterium]
MKKHSFLLLLILQVSNIIFTNTIIAQESVKIGAQTWSTSNLDVKKFRNGDVIKEAKTEEEWRIAAKNKTPMWCYYENDSIQGAKYGKLYNFFAVIDPRGLAPAGWQIPSENDWKVLITSLSEPNSLSGNKLKTKTGWIVNNGNNLSGFNALPAGKKGLDGISIYKGIYAFFWTTTTNTNGAAEYIYLVDFSDKVGNDFTGKGNGFSVRCIKK